MRLLGFTAIGLVVGTAILVVILIQAAGAIGGAAALEIPLRAAVV